MSKGYVTVGAAVALLVLVTAASAQRQAAGVGVAHGDAVAYHGAWRLYSQLAAFWGRQALRAEAAYWAAVRVQ